MLRKPLSIKNVIIITTITSFFLAFILPSIISYVLNPKDNISVALKQNIAMASKNYFKQERNKKIVYLDELIRKGYISDKMSLVQNNCITEASTVSVERKQSEKEVYVVDLYCNSYFSKLTMSN